MPQPNSGRAMGSRREEVMSEPKSDSRPAKFAMSEDEMIERRDKTIAFEMNYCQHYTRGSGANMVCAAGIDLKSVQIVPTGEKGIKWGPCIEGHTLTDPKAHCPHWIRRTREMGEKRADALQRSLDMMTLVMPVVSKWRSKPPFKSQRDVIECPVCKGRLHLSQSSYNGHVHGKCETAGCAAWME